MLKLWGLRIAASLGCLALFAGSVAGALAVLPRSWHDLDDANVRSQVFRIHGIDGDLIWSVAAFASNVVIFVAMFGFCFWMLWILIDRWDMLRGDNEPRQ